MKLCISTALVFLTVTLTSLLATSKDESSVKTFGGFGGGYPGWYGHGIPGRFGYNIHGGIGLGGGLGLGRGIGLGGGLGIGRGIGLGGGLGIGRGIGLGGGLGIGGGYGSLPVFDNIFNGYNSLLPSFYRLHSSLSAPNIDFLAARRLIEGLQQDFYLKVQAIGSRCYNSGYLSYGKKQRLALVLLQLLQQFQSSLSIIYSRWPDQIYGFRQSLARCGLAFKIAFGLLQNLGYSPIGILDKLNLNLFSQFDLNLNQYAHPLFK